MWLTYAPLQGTVDVRAISRCGVVVDDSGVAQQNPTSSFNLNFMSSTTKVKKQRFYFTVVVTDQSRTRKTKQEKKCLSWKDQNAYISESQACSVRRTSSSYSRAHSLSLTPTHIRPRFIHRTGCTCFGRTIPPCENNSLTKYSTPHKNNRLKSTHSNFARIF